MLAVILANVRTPAERRGDLRAQLAACAAGASGLRALIAREGAERVAASGRALIDYTARRAERRFARSAHSAAARPIRSKVMGVTNDPVTIAVALHTRGDGSCSTLPAHRRRCAAT